MAGLRAQNLAHVTGKLTNLIAQFGRPGCRHKPAPGADQQWIACRGPEPCQGAAHGGGTEAEATGRSDHAAFGQ